MNIFPIEKRMLVSVIQSPAIKDNSPSPVGGHTNEVPLLVFNGHWHHRNVYNNINCHFQMLMSSKDVQEILSLVLTLGNYMNGGRSTLFL